MKVLVWGAAAIALASFGASGALAKSSTQGTNHAKLLAHGKYLVTQAAPCADCHTPRDRHGQLIASRALQGAPIDMRPIHPVPGWEDAAPSIAGLPQGWSFDQTVHFLHTGVTPGGGHADPPMPAFRFNVYDARSIAAYLESLPKPKPTAATHR